MEKSLVTSLLTLHPFDEMQMQLLENKITHQILSKNTILYSPKNIAGELHFVLKGSIRQFIETETIPQTIQFYVAGDWVTDLESMLTQKPAQTILETQEETHLATLSLNEIHHLMDRDSCFKKLLSLLHCVGISVEQIKKNTLSPDERYQKLLQEHPNWVQKFALSHIASYLGMTPETLSRVRARIK